jgi:hypothetical protein
MVSGSSAAWQATGEVVQRFDGIGALPKTSAPCDWEKCRFVQVQIPAGFRTRLMGWTDQHCWLFHRLLSVVATVTEMLRAETVLHIDRERGAVSGRAPLGVFA